MMRIISVLEALMVNAIEVEGLSKKFQINHEQENERTWWQKVGNAVAAPIRAIRQGAALGSVEDFWALNDVSFSVGEGKVTGIIGHNGAGKSTLLKLLTRISDPTSGRAVIRGRVGSLLEVGTGFHPELSGRDNIFMNGIILGMSRAEIKKKFDEIVAFAEVDKFLDTPIKRYSSGMRVRLGFAVAARSSAKSSPSHRRLSASAVRASMARWTGLAEAIGPLRSA